MVAENLSQKKKTKTKKHTKKPLTFKKGQKPTDLRSQTKCKQDKTKYPCQAISQLNIRKLKIKKKILQTVGRYDTLTTGTYTLTWMDHQRIILYKTPNPSILYDSIFIIFLS